MTTPFDKNHADRKAQHQQVLDRALAVNRGSRAWREWKKAGAAEIVELANRTDRMQLFEMSLEGDLHICYGVQMPVPRPPVDDKLVIADAAVFHLHYVEEWLWESPPGWGPLGLVQPKDPFHPNCRPALRGAICLGKLPPGTRLGEIALLGYFALTLQDRVLDETDPNGVMNPWASEYFRNHPEYLPLTRAGLLDPWNGVA